MDGARSEGRTELIAGNLPYLTLNPILERGGRGDGTKKAREEAFSSFTVKNCLLLLQKRKVCLGLSIK